MDNINIDGRPPHHHDTVPPPPPRSGIDAVVEDDDAATSNHQSGVSWGDNDFVSFESQSASQVEPRLPPAMGSPYMGSGVLRKEGDSSGGALRKSSTGDHYSPSIGTRKNFTGESPSITWKKSLEESQPVSGQKISVGEGGVTSSAEEELIPESTENYQNLRRPSGLYNLRARSDASASIKARLEVGDVTQQSPLESEAETYIVKLLEARDQENGDATEPPPALTGIDTRAFGSSIASSSAAPRIQSSESRRSVQSRRSVHSPPPAQQHRRTMTMEEKLFDLTAAIGAIQTSNMNYTNLEVGLDENENTSGIHMEGTAEQVGLSSPSSLVLRRRKRAEPSEFPDQNEEQAADADSLELSQDLSSLHHNNASQASSTSREKNYWSRVRAAVHNNKKSDDVVVDTVNPSAVDQMADDDDEENALSASQSSHLHTADPPPPPPPRAPPPNTVRKQISKEWGMAKFFPDFFKPQSHGFFFVFRHFLVFGFVPAILIAGILFYWAGNPPVGILVNQGQPINGTLSNTKGEAVDESVASASWWILFVCRQFMTGTLAKLVEFILVDYLSIQTRASMRFLGPWPTLLLLQSRGWPIILFFWGCLDFSLLYGTGPFFSHWGYWQDYANIFNESNPSGNIIASDWNGRVLAIAVSIGAVVSLKRLWLGIYLGRRTFGLYSDKLAAVMNKILIVSQVASLSRRFERTIKHNGKFPMQCSMPPDSINRLIDIPEDDASFAKTMSERSVNASVGMTGLVIDPDDVHPLTGVLSSTQRAKLSRLLGAWEEPTIASRTTFRRALACLNTQYPFSGSFGLADTRENCVQSAQDTFQRLLLRTPDESVMRFDILAMLGEERDGSLNEKKLKELIKIFRPDRDGSLSMIDFVKSVDAVYKEIRLLRASVSNSSKIDEAFETIFNICFYVVLITTILFGIGVDALSLFLSLSGVVLAFAFMIGSASSKYFEGLLFILVRRPYQIGDSIHVSSVESETSYSGSAWWTVEDVNLFSTTAIFLCTNERASLSNGSLANSRIINSSDSPPAWIYIMLRFPVDVTYEKLQIFNKALEEFFRSRPREWLAFDAFRAVSVAADQGYIEYIVISQHRVTFAEWSALHLSKADLMHFCLELSKKLDINYRSPPLPVELSVVSDAGITSTPNLLDLPTSGGLISEKKNSTATPDLSGLQAMFVPRGIKTK